MRSLRLLQLKATFGAPFGILLSPDMFTTSLITVAALGSDEGVV